MFQLLGAAQPLGCAQSREGCNKENPANLMAGRVRRQDELSVTWPDIQRLLGRFPPGPGQ